MRLQRWPGVALVALFWAAIATPGAPGQTGPSDEYTVERAKALDLMKQGKELDALPILEDLYLKNPNDIVVLESLTNSLLHLAAILPDPEEAGKVRFRAKELIDKAIQLGDHSQLAENLADSMRNLPANGIVKFADKAEVDTALKAGEAAFAKGDFDEAIKNYSRALELDPGSYDAALFVGDSYFAGKKFPQAGEWYHRATEINPNRETAYRYHADMLIKQGDLETARTLSLEAIVAEPYNSITWRALIAWSNVSHVPLQRIRVETAGRGNATPDAHITITLEPNQEAGVGAVWLAYSMERALWQADKFKKQFPNEPQYRHSLAEESGALTSAAKVAEELKGKTDQKEIAQNTDIQLILRLYRANMVEPYVLLGAADQGIAQDYEKYRAANRAKLEQYLSDFIAPPPAKK